MGERGGKGEGESEGIAQSGALQRLGSGVDPVDISLRRDASEVDSAVRSADVAAKERVQESEASAHLGRIEAGNGAPADVSQPSGGLGEEGASISTSGAQQQSPPGVSGSKSARQLFGQSMSKKKSSRAASMSRVELQPTDSMTGGGAAVGGEGGKDEEGATKKPPGHRSALSLLSPSAYKLDKDRSLSLKGVGGNMVGGSGQLWTREDMDFEGEGKSEDKSGILEEGMSEVRKKYEVRKKIGEGRPGVVVYECIERRTGKKCACKSIDKVTLSSPKKVEAMRLEVALLRQLAGIPHVVSMEHVVEDEQVSDGSDAL